MDNAEQSGISIQNSKMKFKYIIWALIFLLSPVYTSAFSVTWIDYSGGTDNFLIDWSDTDYDNAPRWWGEAPTATPSDSSECVINSPFDLTETSSTFSLPRGGYYNSSLNFYQCYSSTNSGSSWTDYIQYTRASGGSGTQWEFTYSNMGVFVNPNTHIETVIPYDGELLATSSTHTIGSTGGISDSDFVDGDSFLRIHIQNSAQSFTQCVSVICSDFATGALSRDFEYELTTASPYVYSSTTEGLPLGKYWMTTRIVVGDWCLFGVCVSSRTLVASSTTFVVSTTTKGDALKDSATEYLDSITDPGGDFEDCSLISFNFFECWSDLIAYAFVPTTDAMEYLGDQLYNNVLTHFPFGYVTDFVQIISTSTASSLPSINATLPIPGIGGQEINLVLDGVLDPILNATSSMFYNDSIASSTQTLFEYTNDWWKKILYLGALFYILSRIFLPVLHKQNQKHI